MNYTEAHIHHLAKKAHNYKSKLEEVLGDRASVVERAVGLLEIGAGAWAGGMVEGRFAGDTFLHVPPNLLGGLLFNAAGFLGESVFGKEWAPHLNTFGNGMIASWTAALGFTFGQRWQQTGKLLGGAPVVALPATAPAAAPAKVSGAEMDAIIDEMSKVAANHR